MVLDSLFNHGTDYLKQTSEDIGKYVDSYSIHHVKRPREINSFCSASNSLLMQAARIAKMLMAAGNGACGSKRKRTGRVPLVLSKTFKTSDSTFCSPAHVLHVVCERGGSRLKHADQNTLILPCWYILMRMNSTTMGY